MACSLYLLFLTTAAAILTVTAAAATTPIGFTTTDFTDTVSTLTADAVTVAAEATVTSAPETPQSVESTSLPHTASTEAFELPKEPDRVSFEVEEDAEETIAAQEEGSLADEDMYDEDMDGEDLFSSGSLKERYLVTALKLRKQRCPGTVNGRTAGGVCLDKGECLLKKGWKAGHCALLGTCCYFEHTCGQTAHYKVSHFAAPKEFHSECELRVHVHSRDVCQIRVDFEEFSLAPPERDSSPDDVEAAGAWRCVRDRFTVDAPGTGFLGFDALCGRNRGQHIYVPVNATSGSTAMRLRFHLANRTAAVNGSLLAPARWMLRITQLECAAAEYDYSTLHAALASATHEVVNKHVLGAHDADLLAPQGCLQYYPERQGEYMSFNYRGRAYFGDLHYAICFRRRPGDCGIRHTASDFFLIDFNEYGDQMYVDRYCDTRDPLQSCPHNYTGDDYLFVPNGIGSFGLAQTMPSPMASKYCGLALDKGDTITSYAAGPFYVYFHSDDFTFRRYASDVGFRMRYDVLAGSCRVNDPGTSGSLFG